MDEPNKLSVRGKEMSAIPTYIQVEHIRLEAGEVLVLDGVIYLIESVERLVYSERITLPAAARASASVMANLRPEDDEVYHCEYIGITHEYYENSVRFVFPSGALFWIQYPRGDTRFYPHGLTTPLTENLANIYDPFRIDLWVKPATEPVITADNVLAQEVRFQVWFYGWKYRTKVISKADMDAARQRDVKVLEIERYVSK